MIRVITMFILLVCSSLTAQSKFEQGMQKAFALREEGKTTEAIAMFERIAAAEKENWLSYYYVALFNTIEAFQAQDKEKMSALLNKAQAAQDNAAGISPNNAELLVMQAMIDTGWLMYDPMTNGMRLSGKINELYTKAMVIAPNNPRVVFSKAEFDMGSAAYFGRDTKPMCSEVERSITLFANFKPETPYHPNWGLDRAQETLQQCKK